jgi:hypothetical protein
MSEEEKIDPGHQKVLKVLRTVGPILLVLGGLCTLVAFIDLVRVMMDISDWPRFFWLFFVGGPLIFLGSALTSTGYAGRIARFHAAQYAPGAKDTFNYMAEGTQDGIKTVARSVAEGIQEAGVAATSQSKETLKCPACGFVETGNAAYCSGCGKPLVNSTEI